MSGLFHQLLCSFFARGFQSGKSDKFQRVPALCEVLQGRFNLIKKQRFACYKRDEGFPVFIGNVLAYLGGSKIEANETTVQPGQAVALRTQNPVADINVQDPDGQRVKVQRGSQATYLYGSTDRLGVYQVREGDEDDVKQRFAVNLFDVVESNIPPSETVDTKWESIPGQATWDPTRREAWKYLLFAGLVILLLEWYIYNRRVYV